jgi:hypothetical protein
MRKWLLSLGLVCVMTVQLWAAYPVKPYTFTNNTVADATEVNANYDALYNGLSTGLNDANIYRLYIGGTTVIDNTRNASFTTGTFTGTIIGTREALSDWLTVAGTLGVTGKLSAVNVAVSGWQTVAGTLGVTGLTSVTSLTATGNTTATNIAASGWETVAGTLGVTGLTSVTSLTATGQIAGVNASFASINVYTGPPGYNSYFQGTSGTTGNHNIAIGAAALNVATTETLNNIAIGYYSLSKATKERNIALGYQAGAGVTTGEGNIFIGDNVGGTSVNYNERLFVDNSTTTTPLIDGNFATDTLTINNKLILPAATAPTSGTTEGTIYYNVSTHKLNCWDGSAWQVFW